ncbi:DnaD domain-containing protein [Virgibacillus sp. W0430]|uniref:DnaD domain-containing protein n=1 Tax=Virgibacillus sp. W0430 TaxID=3391580 RepID=UPI003F461137
MKGFISLHRKLMDNPIWSDPNYLKLWIYCLFEASHTDREQLVGNQMIEIKRGQFITGRFALSEELNKGVKPKQRLDKLTWWRYLNNLQKQRMLNIKSTNKYSVVTIIKYDVYQNVFNKTEHGTEHQLNNKRTTDEQQMNTNNNYNNLNNYIKISTTTSAHEKNDAIVFYQNNIGMIRPQISEEMLDWINDFGDEMVIEAMKRSLERNKPSWGYTKSILKSWHEKGIKTIEQANAEDIEFKNQQQSRFSKQPIQKETVPDWFKQRKRQGTSMKTEQPVDEKEKAEIMAMLAKHTSKASGES